MPGVLEVPNGPQPVVALEVCSESTHFAVKTCRSREVQGHLQVACARAKDMALWEASSVLPPVLSTKVRDTLSDDATPKMTALNLCFQEYNSTSFAATQTKFMLTDVDQWAIKNLIFGVAEQVRTTMAAHLHQCKEADSGCTCAIL